MRMEFLTICLDGLPWISRIWPELEKLPFHWRWHVVEGVASNVHCTHWCAEIPPRLSNDGTTQYLDSVAAYDPRVIIHRKEQWQGKIAMVNEPLRFMHAPAILMEMDSDELWTSEQICIVRQMFIDNPDKNTAQFVCDYRVGRGISIDYAGDRYGNNANEWKRAWRYQPGMRFKNHEPPSFENHTEQLITRERTKELGLVFRHEAYSTEAQVRFKSEFYSGEKNPAGKLYVNAIAKWRALQRTKETKIPDLSKYLPWCGHSVSATKTTP